MPPKHKNGHNSVSFWARATIYSSKCISWYGASLTVAPNFDISSRSKVIFASIWQPFCENLNYSTYLKFDFRFVIYAPELVELDYFEPYLFIFHRYLLLAKISQKFGKYVRLTVCLSVCLSATRYSSQFLTNHHQTWSTYGVWYKDHAYSFSRSKVK